MTPQNPEAFSPGEYISEELEARGWSQLDLAEILGRPPQAVNEIIKSKRAISPETARGLADAFGTSAQMWMNLQSAYDLAKMQHSESNVVSRKAKLYEFAPVGEMQKRGWIEKSSNFDIVEAQVLSFFDIRSIADAVELPAAARKSSQCAVWTPPQRAWLARARQLAKTLQVTRRFTAKALRTAMNALALLKSDPEEIRKVPRVLSEAGIRFLIVAPLPQSKIDGACFWLSDDEPVVALSFRYDRIDWFWHTLMHEMAHVKNRDGTEAPTLDTELVGVDAQPFEDKGGAEKEADLFAVNYLVSQTKLDKFVARVHPLYSKLKISAFANSNEVHPGIVVGQLQYRKKIAYAHSRDLLVKVRNIVISSALTDGWGSTISA